MYITQEIENIHIMIMMTVVSSILLFSFLEDTINNHEIKNKYTYRYGRIIYLNLLFQISVLIDSCVYAYSSKEIIYYIFTYLYIQIGYLLSREYALFAIEKFLKEKIKENTKIINFCFYIFAILLTLFAFTGLYYKYTGGSYERGPLYFLSLVFPMFSCIFSLLVVIKSHIAEKREQITFIVCTSIIVLGQVLQIISFSYSFMAYAYTFVAIFFYVNFFANIRNELSKIETELSEDKIKIIQMQMQPHFMYNSLSSIAQLIKTDSDEAYIAINEFTEYLRGNLDSLSNTELVPFYKELRHVKSFAILEKYRFGDRINMVYEIEVENFMLPALTIEPIVENALRYGISKKEKGGTVILKTTEMGDYIYIWVMDDGIGYDIDKEYDTSRKHIGLDNVRKRIEKMVKGTLTIESEPGIGTKVLVKIPKEI